MINGLLDAGCPVTARSLSGSTPLHYAAHAGQAEVVGLLLERAAQIDQPDKRGWGCLFWAVDAGAVGTVKRLLRMKASTDSVDLTGNTALHLTARAAEPNRCAQEPGLPARLVECCQLLLASGVSPQRLNADAKRAAELVKCEPELGRLLSEQAGVLAPRRLGVGMAQVQRELEWTKFRSQGVLEELAEINQRLRAADLEWELEASELQLAVAAGERVARQWEDKAQSALLERQLALLEAGCEGLVQQVRPLGKHCEQQAD